MNTESTWTSVQLRARKEVEEAACVT
jgi:hypothetical protein